jgi:hypothetical protein
MDQSFNIFHVKLLVLYFRPALISFIRHMLYCVDVQVLTRESMFYRIVAVGS